MSNYNEMIIKQHPNENDWKTALKADNKKIKIHNKDLNNDIIQRELELGRLDPGDVHHTLDYHLNIDSKNSATLTNRSTTHASGILTTYSSLYQSPPCFAQGHFPLRITITSNGGS